MMLCVELWKSIALLREHAKKIKLSTLDTRCQIACLSIATDKSPTTLEVSKEVPMQRKVCWQQALAFHIHPFDASNAEDNIIDRFLVCADLAGGRGPCRAAGHRPDGQASLGARNLDQPRCRCGLTLQ